MENNLRVVMLNIQDIVDITEFVNFIIDQSGIQIDENNLVFEEEEDDNAVLDVKSELALIKKLVVRKIYRKHLSFNDDCCICLSKFKQKQRVSQIKTCKHVFCVSCLQTWLKFKKNKCCPLCRSNVVVK
ncbi:ubiquitin ligase [Orgyia pseudotsugata single capsid nuclopolyhedrovirus]|nr:ubiquitin ligase [Orgyia pseudotsugata single capsid nuclopolyhedrovirus]